MSENPLAGDEPVGLSTRRPPCVVGFRYSASMACFQFQLGSRKAARAEEGIGDMGVEAARAYPGFGPEDACARGGDHLMSWSLWCWSLWRGCLFWSRRRGVYRRGVRRRRECRTRDWQVIGVCPGSRRGGPVMEDKFVELHVSRCDHSTAVKVEATIATVIVWISEEDTWSRSCTELVVGGGCLFGKT